MLKFNKLISTVSFFGMLAGAVGGAHAGLLLDEGFNTFLPAGWARTNNSSPVGTTEWFAGNAGIFPAQAGPAGSYAAANFLAADTGGDISNWLFTPTVSLINGSVFRFFTRTESGSQFPDRLEVRASANGASTNVGATATSVGDFTTLLLTINPALATGGYPEDWTQFTVTLSGFAPSAQGRLAFRYFVNDTSVNADYLGVDTVQLEAVPEPSTLLVLALGLTVLGWHLRRAAVG